MNLKKKIYLYANSTTQSCPNEIMKNFLIEDFFHFHFTGSAPWAANISANFQKLWNGPNGVIRGLGETDPCRKTWSQKSRNTVPLSCKESFSSWKSLHSLQKVCTTYAWGLFGVPIFFFILYCFLRLGGTSFLFISYFCTSILLHLLWCAVGKTSQTTL